MGMTPLPRVPPGSKTWCVWSWCLHFQLVSMELKQNQHSYPLADSNRKKAAGTAAPTPPPHNASAFFAVVAFFSINTYSSFVINNNGADTLSSAPSPFKIAVGYLPLLIPPRTTPLQQTWHVHSNKYVNQRGRNGESCVTNKQDLID